MGETKSMPSGANRQSAFGNRQFPSVFNFSRALMAPGAKDNEHLVAFHAWPGFHFAHVRQIAFQLFQNARAQFPVRHFTPAKPNCGFDFVTLLQPFTRMLHTVLVVVIIRARTKLNFLDCNGDLFFLRLVRLFLRFVLELTEVDDAADGRLSSWSDFHQIQALLSGGANRIPDIHYSQLLAFVSDDAHLGNSNSFVNADRWETSVVRTLAAAAKACSYCCTSSYSESGVLESGVLESGVPSQDEYSFDSGLWTPNSKLTRDFCL